MSADQKCSNCKHRDGHYVCREQASLQFTQQVSPTHCCGGFLSNPGSYPYNEAVAILVRNAVQDSASCPERQQEVPCLLEKALTLGLPTDDEIMARSFLASIHLEQIEDLSENHVLSKVIGEFEEAAGLDRQGQLGVLAKHRSLFMQWDGCYCLMYLRVNEESGPNAAQRYIEEKLRLYEYLPSIPLINAMYELAKHFLRTGDTARACHWLHNIVRADTVNLQSEAEKQVRAEAETALRTISN